MKLHLFKYAALLGMALLSLVSCRKDNGPEVPKDNVEIKMELVEVGEGHISFSVSTKHAESFAWYCTSNLEEEVKSAEYVFSHGNEENATEESKTVTVEGLDPSTQYLVYAAVRNEFSEQIRSISASTTAAEVKKYLLREMYPRQVSHITSIRSRDELTVILTSKGGISIISSPLPLRMRARSLT